jgi:hypothetical protein
MENQHLVFTVKLESNQIKNVIRKLLAGERHETVQPKVLSSPQPEHFNLDAKSESLPAPKSDEPPQMGSRRSRPDIVYLLRTYKTQRRGGAGEAQATRLRNAYQERRRVQRVLGCRD